jgi:pimeloyl-ACP methyl ester carboxylesterase
MRVKRVVASLHGIRTRGVWQKDLAPVLASHGFVPYPLDYGNFSALRLLLPFSRKGKVDWLRQECERIAKSENVNRLSIIAHSLGSLLVAEMLEKYESIKVDKVIFAGSIVKEDFDWPRLLKNGQVNLVENDVGKRDIWPRLANQFVRGAGAAGTKGFSKKHPLIISREFLQHTHSDYFHPTHFTAYWIPTLRRTVFNDADQKPFIEAMNLAAGNIATRLGIAKKCIRANIFVQDEPDRLSIPVGLQYNMDDEQERSISIPVGAGCTGRSFSERQPAIAIFQQGWGKYDLPDDEAKKVNRDLQWIISTPIPDPDDKWSMLGIFNIDCLEVRKDKAELESLLYDLNTWAQALGRIFKKVQ